MIQIVVLVLGLEVALRVVRPHHGWLNSVLYTPAFRTQFDDFETTEDLLASSFLGSYPNRVACGFVLNSLGLRTKEYSAVKDPGAYRIAAIGDSFTFASGCLPWPRLWAVQLEDRLDRDMPSRQADVLSFGVPGAGPRFQLRMWELEVRRLDPDLVILAFFVGNDIFEEQKVDLVPTAESRLVRLSYGFRLARNLKRIFEAQRQGGAVAPEATVVGERFESGGFPLLEYEETFDPDKATLSEEIFLKREWNRLQIVRESGRKRFDRLFEGLTPVLSRFHHDVEAAGVDFMVMLIPDQFQVDAGVLAQVRAQYDIREEQLDLDLPQRRLRAFFEDKGIVYLDLLPLFREEGRKRELYRPRNTHWNYAGNALAADALNAFVQEH